jgi:hypothetical protein
MTNENKIEQHLAEIEQLNADLYCRVGMLCTLFSGLETQIRDCIILIEESHDIPKSDCLPPDEPCSRTLKRFKKLLKQCLPAIVAQEGLSLVPRLKMVGQRRNDIVHSSWNATCDNLFHQKRVRPQKAKLQVTDIPDAFGAIEEVTEETAELIFELECFKLENLSDAEKISPVIS